MTEINRKRGDVAIALLTDTGPRDFVLRPTYEAAGEIESVCNMGIVALSARVRMHATLLELGAIVAAGMRAAGEKAATAKACAQMIWETGIAECNAPIGAFMVELMTGGKATKEPKPGEGGAADPGL